MNEPGDFEDLKELARCMLSDCTEFRLNDRTPLCAEHLAEQERKSAGWAEPALEQKLLTEVRTEDDDHPGQVKVYNPETGEPSWVPAEPDDPRLYRKPDPASLFVAGRDVQTPEMKRAQAMEEEWMALRQATNREPKPTWGYAERLAELERKVYNDDGTTSWEVDAHRLAEELERRTELLDLVRHKLIEIRDAPSRDRVRVTIHALLALLAEELRGEW